MFSVTPVPENRGRKVSFSPDIDESYRHQVVDKIKNLMEEVQVITDFDFQPHVQLINVL